MEDNISDAPLDPSAARAHLHGARAAETAGRFPPIAVGVVLLDAVLVAAFVLTSLSGDRQTELMALVGMLLVFVNAVAITRVRVVGSGATTAGTAVAAVVLAVVIVGSFLLESSLDAAWPAVVGAVLAAVTVLATGQLYRQSAGRWK